MKHQANLKFDNQTIQFVTCPYNKFFGYTQERIGESEFNLVGWKSPDFRLWEEVTISTREKTIIDSLAHLEYAGGISEVAKAIWTAKGELNFGQMVDWAERMGVRAVSLRLGYLLELIDFDRELYERLLPRKNPGAPWLDPSSKKIQAEYSSRWGGNETYLRQITQRVIETLSSQVSWNALKEETEISTHDTARWYIDTLKNSFVVSYIHDLDKGKDVPYHRKAKKIYFGDPFIFHAMRWWAFGGTRPFDETLQLLKNTEEKSRLIESIICDHMIRLLFDLEPSPQFDYTTKLFYWESGKKREVDFVTKLGDAYLPIELKYQSTIQRNDAYSIIDFMKGGKAHKGIIVTKDALTQERSYVGIPAPLFLLLV